MKIRRMNEIYDFVAKNDFCTYPELMEKFGVSLSTIRRDIEILEKEGKIEKVYGGIKAKQVLSFSSSFDNLKNAFLNHKDSPLNAIGEKAATLVNDDEVIIMGSGYTVASMMPYLSQKKGITIITNSLLIVYPAIEYNIKTHFVGGDIRSSTFSTTGIRTTSEFDGIQANKAFLSCNGITTKGFSNATEMESIIKKSIIKISKETIMMTGSNKFEKIGLYTFASPSEINYLVTDKKPKDEYIELFESAGTKVIY